MQTIHRYIITFAILSAEFNCMSSKLKGRNKFDAFNQHQKSRCLIITCAVRKLIQIKSSRESDY